MDSDYRDLPPDYWPENLFAIPEALSDQCETDWMATPESVDVVANIILCCDGTLSFDCHEPSPRPIVSQFTT